MAPCRAIPWICGSCSARSHSSTIRLRSLYRLRTPERQEGLANIEEESVNVQSRGRWLLTKLPRPVLVLTFVCLAASATNQTPQGEQLDQEVRSIFAAYKAKRYDQALAQIKPLLARFPDTFEVNELMGLIYAAEVEDESAIPFLKSAVRIRPQSVPARTSLALSLVRVGQISLAEVEFKKA